MYSSQLLQYFESPAHSGDLPAANTRIRVENPVCGDIIEFSALLQAGTVKEVRYKAKACVPAMACASALCHLVSGKPLEAIAEITAERLAGVVGGVPSASQHALQMNMEGLRRLLGSAR